jgi:hypothetical protein
MARGASWRKNGGAPDVPSSTCPESGLRRPDLRPEFDPRGSPHVLSTRIIAAAAATATLVVPAATSHAALTTPESMLLDTATRLQASRIGFSGPATTGEALANGGYYVAQARGTFSRYLPRLMRNETLPGIRRCGTPEAAPLIPSPGKPDSPVGIDPEWAFSYVVNDLGPGSCPSPVIRPIGAFEINTGDGFIRIPAVNRGTGPRSDHSYTYLLQGIGRPVSFRYLDNPLADNNGVIAITVRPATAADCGADAACLASIASGATPAPAPVPPPSTTSSASTTAQAVFAGSAPTAKACVSRRRFRIRLVDRKRDPIVAATVRVNGKTVQVLNARLGGRTRKISYVDLRGLPASNSIRVTITARLKSKKTLRGTRTYRTCSAKLEGGRPRL